MNKDDIKDNIDKVDNTLINVCLSPTLPNKIYILEEEYLHPLGHRMFFSVLIAASDRDTALKYAKDKLGIQVPRVTWVMGAGYGTIYNQYGTSPLKVQAKILYNNPAVVEDQKQKA